MRGRSTSEGKVNLNQRGSPHAQMGEYTCVGKVDLVEGTVSEGKLVDNHRHHHLRLHSHPPPPPPNDYLNS